jgi:phosphoglycolate phosphatase-like HAD superfamily hydrolase
MKKLAVFDVDGTILDSITFFERMINDYSRRNGLRIPCIESLKQGYHDPLNHDFKWGLSRQEQKLHLHNAWEEADAASVAGLPGFTPALFDGAALALEELKDHGFTLAIVTSKAEAPLLRLFDEHKIGGLFSATRVWDDSAGAARRKSPSPTCC